jgi:hypothetical protein
MDPIGRHWQEHADRVPPCARPERPAVVLPAADIVARTVLH